MSDQTHVLRSGQVAATIKRHGAELCSLKTAAGGELIWQAGPEWPRHSPLLFPIVGRLNNDELRHRGKAYPMTQHGVARDHDFEWVARDESSAALVLADNDETRKRYPFAFRLAVTFALNESDLDVTFEVTNTGREMLPASIGAHPAFNWPLLPTLGKDSYTLTFSDDEPAPIRRLRGGLMRAKPETSPIKAGRLALSEQLFEDDLNSCSRTTPSSLTGSRVRLSATVRTRAHPSKCPGTDFRNSGSGQSRARPFFALSRGADSQVPKHSTASSRTSQA